MSDWTLDRLPGMAGLYATALKRGILGNGLSSETSLPEDPVRLSQAVVSDPQRLAAYRALCGLEDDGRLPPLWPQVLAGPLAGFLLARDEVPVPILGLVHMQNRVEQSQEIPDDTPLHLSVRLQGPRPARRGVTFDVIHEASVDGAVVWTGILTALVQLKGVRNEDIPRAKLPADLPQTPVERFAAPSDLGRRYAGISGDYNPIHLHPLVAKPFGFRRAIATGMWTAARALAVVHGGKSTLGTTEFRFRKPVYLPSQLDCAVDPPGDLRRWVVRCGETLCLEGSCRV